ncbi:adipolin-like isoform X2 [Branchiostoma floridae x Branchiostoma japonicum]
MSCSGVIRLLFLLAVGWEACVVAASKVRAVRSYRGEVPVFDNDYYALEHNETVVNNEHDDEVFPGSHEVDKPVQVDPRGSWMSFVKHSNNGNKNNGRKKRKEQEKSLHGPPGPQGPPGPRGPAGPPGAVITKDEMFREFKEMVREAAERRALRLLQEKCPKCLNVSQHLGIWPYWDDTNSPPKLHDAFHCRLRGNVVIPRKTLMELKNFQTPFGGGAFVRGTGLNLREGRFTAHRPGVYHFSATLHIGHPRQKRLRPRDSVRALICINSLCQRHTSLEVVTGIESNSRVFTISVSGMLELQSGQYTSIFMDNSSKKPITVQSGSDFTANFVGQ